MVKAREMRFYLNYNYQCIVILFYCKYVTILLYTIFLHLSSQNLIFPDFSSLFTIRQRAGCAASCSLPVNYLEMCKNLVKNRVLTFIYKNTHTHSHPETQGDLSALQSILYPLFILYVVFVVNFIPYNPNIYTSHLMCTDAELYLTNLPLLVF